MTPLVNIVKGHGLNIISYSDDTQLILSLTNDPTTTKDKLLRNMKEVAAWMNNNCLKLNTDKTEVLLFGLWER